MSHDTFRMHRRQKIRPTALDLTSSASAGLHRLVSPSSFLQAWPFDSKAFTGFNWRKGRCYIDIGHHCGYCSLHASHRDAQLVHEGDWNG